MSAKEQVAEARKALDEAKANLQNAARDAIADELKTIFADPEVGAVRWAQKSSEYDDEGMYPGVHGPEVLTLEEWESGDDDTYDLVGYGSVFTPDEAQGLKQVLDDLGVEALSEIFGDENIVTARRSAAGVEVSTEYYGY